MMAVRGISKPSIQGISHGFFISKSCTVGSPWSGTGAVGQGGSPNRVFAAGSALFAPFRLRSWPLARIACPRRDENLRAPDKNREQDSLQLRVLFPFIAAADFVESAPVRPLVLRLGCEPKDDVKLGGQLADARALDRCEVDGHGL